MKKLSKKEEIQKKIRELSEENRKIENEEYKASFPKLKALEGKTYAYRGNTFGSGDKWDVFYRILQVFLTRDESIVIVTESCEINCHGTATLTVDTRPSWSGENPLLRDCCEECGLEEFEDNKRKALAQFADPSAIRKYYKAAK